MVAYDKACYLQSNKIRIAIKILSTRFDIIFHGGNLNSCSKLEVH